MHVAEHLRYLLEVQTVDFSIASPLWTYRKMQPSYENLDDYDMYQRLWLHQHVPAAYLLLLELFHVHPVSQLLGATGVEAQAEPAHHLLLFGHAASIVHRQHERYVGQLKQRHLKWWFMLCAFF